jgi:putative ABC transport system permease protein
VSGRMREFGIRMAIGSQPHAILAGVVSEGVLMSALGVLAGAFGGYALAMIGGSYLEGMKLPSALPILAAAGVLVLAAVAGSLLPAARAARVDVVQALRAE